MVLREPIERAISNIIQFSPEPRDGRALFCRYDTEHKKYSAGYWDSIYEILIKEYPIPTITIHDNFYLRNCMSNMIGGNQYKDFNQDIDMDFVFSQLDKMNISFYDDFNNGLQANFDKLNIPIDMSRNHIPINSNKKKLGKYYGAPDKVIELVRENNQNDIKLYKHLRSDY